MRTEENEGRDQPNNPDSTGRQSDFHGLEGISDHIHPRRIANGERRQADCGRLEVDSPPLLQSMIDSIDGMSHNQKIQPTEALSNSLQVGSTTSESTELPPVPVPVRLSEAAPPIAASEALPSVAPNKPAAQSPLHDPEKLTTTKTTTKEEKKYQKKGLRNRIIPKKKRAQEPEDTTKEEKIYQKKGLRNRIIPKKKRFQKPDHTTGPTNQNYSVIEMPQLRGLGKNVSANPNKQQPESRSGTIPQLRGLRKNANASAEERLPIAMDLDVVPSTTSIPGETSQRLAEDQEDEGEGDEGASISQVRQGHSVFDNESHSESVESETQASGDGNTATDNVLCHTSAASILAGDSSLPVAQPVPENTESTMMMEAEEVDPLLIERGKIKEQSEKRCGLICFGIMAASGIVLALSLWFGLSTQKKEDGNGVINIPPSATPSVGPSELLSVSPTGFLDEFLGSLPDFTLESMNDPSSPQSKAKLWLKDHPNISNIEEWRKEQLFGLVTFYYSFLGEYWPKGLSEDWLDYDRNECEWWSSLYGGFLNNEGKKQYWDFGRWGEESTCDSNGHFIKLSISQNGALEGSSLSPKLPREISLLSNLNMINIDSRGSLTDLLPSELADMSNLESITIFQYENIGGSIPATLGTLTQLTQLHLESNSEGELLPEVVQMTSLKALYISIDGLSGTIPSTFGTLTHLEELSLAGSLFGAMPSELGCLTELQLLNLGDNKLTGTVPSDFANLRNLTTLSLENNTLTGTVPSEIFSLPSLERLYLKGNSIESSVVVPRPEASTANYSPPFHTQAESCKIFLRVRPLELVFSVDDNDFNRDHEFNQTFEIGTTILTGPDLILQGVRASLDSNFPSKHFNLTNILKAQLQTLAEGETVSAFFTAKLDLLVANSIKSFEMLVTVVADTKNEVTGEAFPCRSSELHSFLGGIPLMASPTLPPTAAPTTTPTQSLMPTQSRPPSKSPTQSQFPTYDNVRSGVAPVALQGGAEWADLESYPAKAIMWLETDPFSAGLSQARIQQRYALACIYHATYAVGTIYTVMSPRGWINSTGWMGDTDECSWYGLTCNANAQVEKIVLARNRITGSFPAETKIMAGSLTHIDLSRNSVYNTGDDGHAWLGDLVYLRELFLGQTNFEYNGIPPHIGMLTNLIEYDCSFTLYFGPLLGSTFANLQNLEYLVLSGNAYNTSIPIEIGQLPNLQFLYVQDAFVNGDLSFMQPMQSIVECWVDKNPGLGGNIPTFIGEIQSLQRMWLYDNMLTGPVPVELGNLFKLQLLELENNLLTGVMPGDICLNRIPLGLLGTLSADCGGNPAQISCDCCTGCST